jgi:branched-chain amino acid transport system substrate-binding protein
MHFGNYRFLRLLGLLLAGVLVLGACGGGDDNKDNASTGTTSGGSSGGGVKCDGLAIGFFGALTGPNANLGLNEHNGAKVAIQQFNDDNKDCKIELKKFDSQGSPDQAPQLAQQAVQDKSVIGLIGPAFSGESRTANPIFDQAGLSVITASATGVDLSTKGWKIFHRAVGNDNAQGPAIVDYLKTELNAKSIAVLDDKSEYGKGIADIVRQGFGSGVKVNDSFDDKTTEFSSTVNKVKAGNVDAVVFGGYYSQGGPLAKQLKDGGVTAKFIGPDGVNDKGFVEGAGPAAEGAILTAPSAPSEAVEGASDFIDKYKQINKTDVGLYSLEAYDAANVYLECIKKGNTTREKIESCLDSIQYKGLTKTYKWAANGELDGKVTIYAYKVESGTIKGIGPIGS